MGRGDARVVMFAIALAALAAITATVTLAGEMRPFGCVNNPLSVLGKDDIEMRGLAEKLALFKAAVEKPQPDDPSRTILSIPIDCPPSGHFIRSVKLAPTFSAPSIMPRHATEMETLYGVYVDPNALKGMPKNAIELLARQELCVIKNGGAQDEGPPSATNTAAIIACQFAAAQAEHANNEEAYWLARKSPGTPAEVLDDRGKAAVILMKMIDEWIRNRDRESRKPDR